MDIQLRTAPIGDITANPAQFPEAVKAFRQRLPVTDDEYDAMEEDERKHAFTVAGVAQAEIVTDVWEAIDDAVAEGIAFDEFRETVGAKLFDAWGDADGSRLETIFRTNVQLSYSAGRYDQMTDPDVMDARPYWQFRAVLDDRTSDICEPLDNHVSEADDDWWAENLPPLHPNCRSTFVALTEDEARAEGIEPAPNGEPPTDGFGEPPAIEDDWEPDLSKYPEPIAAILRERLK